MFGYWPGVRGKGQFEAFDKARKAAEAGLDDLAVIETSEGDRLTVDPNGFKWGVYCRWVLKWNGCVIAIVNNPKVSDSRISVFVGIGSLRLMQVGHHRAWQEVLDVVKSLGFVLVRNVVSRCDLCVDLPDVRVDQFVKALNEDEVIRRARKTATYKDGYEWEGLRVGRAIGVRIYDKAREVQKDPFKHALIQAVRWGGACKWATRVEFQVRNAELFKHFKIKTVEELFQRLGTVVKWLASDWFRFVVGKVDRKNKNQKRNETVAFWKDVQEKFLQWTGEGPARERCRVVRPDMRQLKKQSIGCITTALLMSGEGCETFKEYARAAHAVVEDVLLDGWWKVEKKLRKLSANGVLLAVEGQGGAPF